MNDKDRKMLEYFGIADQVREYGDHVHIAKVAVIPDDDKAFVRIVLMISGNPDDRVSIS